MARVHDRWDEERWKEKEPVNILPRSWWYQDGLDQTSYSKSRPQPCEPPGANLVGSLLPDGLHGPCIDLDFPCRLYPSRTPGHFHLYLEKPLAWEDYKALLLAFEEAGLVDSGWYDCTLRDQQSFLRPPQGPSCTTGEPSLPLSVASDPEVHRIIHALLGVREGETDIGLQKLGRHMETVLSTALDEIVARRVQAALAGKPDVVLALREIVPAARHGKGRDCARMDEVLEQYKQRALRAEYGILLDDIEVGKGEKGLLRVAVLPRGLGKTTKLLKWVRAAPKDQYRALVSQSREARDQAFRQSQTDGGKKLDSHQFIAAEDLAQMARAHFRGVSGEVVLGVDDVDVILQVLLGCGVGAVTMTGRPMSP